MPPRNPIVIALFLASLAGTASAIDLGSLKNAVGGTDAGSLLSSNSGNVAGIVQFCIKNKYLNDDVAGGIKDKLLGKLSLGATDADTKSKAGPDEDNSGYANGLKGLLSTKDGNSIDLSNRTDKLKEKLTEKACDVVLDQAKSLIGD